MVSMYVMSRPWLPEHHHHHHPNAPLLAPAAHGAHCHSHSHSHSHLHRQLNFYIGIVLVVFMVVGVVALICCCYHLEWRLRLQARNQARWGNRSGTTVISLGSHEMITRVGKKIKQETNLSVMMPGDSIPSFLAKAKPHGSSSNLLISEAKDTTSSQTLR